MCLVELISGLILVCLVAVFALTGPLSLMSHWALLMQHFPDISTMTKWLHLTIYTSAKSKQMYIYSHMYTSSYKAKSRQIYI